MDSKYNLGQSLTPVSTSLNAGVGMVKPMSAIEGEINSLQNTTESLSISVASLHTRLSTVLRSPTPQGSNVEGKSVELSPLPNAIRTSRENIQRSINEIHDILDRLEL